MGDPASVLEEIQSLGGRFYSQTKGRETKIQPQGDTISVPGLFIWFHGPDFNDLSLEDGIPWLSKVPGLKGVRVTGASVSEEGLRKLQDALPDLWIDHLKE